MSWGKHETLLEKRRSEMATGPRQTIQAMLHDLSQNMRPRERARSLGLLAAGYRNIGDMPQAYATIAQARAVPKAGAAARAEISIQETTTRVHHALQGGSWNIALKSAIATLKEAERLPRTNGDSSRPWW